MANQDLNGKKVAFLATDGVEQVELTEPWDKIKAAGATVEVISPKPGKIQGVNHMDKGDTFMDKGDTFSVDKTLDQANPDDYDGLVLPGGVANPDFLRTEDAAVKFTRSFFEAGKPVAAICHGPWTLVEAS